ncbi:MAG: Rrf2 family transcriptional regulator [Ferruginibacter sp.]|nr:Rrf2 family transcriptional regulator [Ferruginibacter sp.]
MLSKTCEYALRAMIYVAQHSNEQRMVSIKEIAANIDSPELFIGKILQSLSKKGFLQSSKGRNGGFYLTEKDARNSLADIVLAVDGDKIFTGCGVGLHYCSEKHPCPIHHEYKKTRKEVYRIYKQATLEHFRDMTVQSDAYLKRQ